LLIKISRDPKDNSRDKDRLEYYIWLAKLADKGKITSIFFADGYGLMQTYQGKPDATFRGGSMVAYLDPVVLISAMAAVSKSVAFGITSSTSYICKSLPQSKHNCIAPNVQKHRSSWPELGLPWIMSQEAELRGTL